jgi:hypothetical protein
MREWNLKTGDPLCLTLAADARLGPTDYTDDQIWELSLGSGEPPALSLQTTFGLRARSLRLFPRFVAGDEVRMDPTGFFSPPVVKCAYPNYLALQYSPFLALDVRSEYWVPESHAAAGRLTIKNESRTARNIRLDWNAVLSPNDGQRMAVVEMQAAQVLSGLTGGLAPVVILTGSPQAGRSSYPSLNVRLELKPGETRVVTWVHAALDSPEASFALARSLASRPWDAEIARLELLNAGLVEIYTGNADWDAAFAMTQKAAFGLLTGPTPHLPYPSFVLNRLPDQGYSLRGTGSDYNHLWNGQTPLDVYTLVSLLLPSAPDLAENLLRNFISVQEEDGFIDWKPGLAGQRSRLIAAPLLATTAWRIYEHTQNRGFLAEVFPPLLRFLQCWFQSEHDRDEDGLPEWDHPMQSGLEDSPLFSRWYEGAQGVDISTAEGPSLCAFLHQECLALERMADCAHHPEEIPALQEIRARLEAAIASAWDEADLTYHYWDRDTHSSPAGRLLGTRFGPGELLVDEVFSEPQRLLVRVTSAEDSAPHPQIFSHGIGMSGNPRVERLEEEGFRWHMGTGSLTSPRTYAAIDRLEILGLGEHDRLDLFSVNYRLEDIGLLLPLWTGIPSSDQVEALLSDTLVRPSRYGQEYGLPACPENELSLPQVCTSVHIPWNTLVGEGLLRYGKRAEAARLVERLMGAVVNTLKSESSFRRYYHACSGQGLGERNALSGLAPLGLFLETLGLRLYSPHRIGLSGFNPYPWPVTVKYRGTTVLLQREKSMIIFPDGQTLVVRDPAPQIATLAVSTPEPVLPLAEGEAVSEGPPTKSAGRGQILRRRRKKRQDVEDQP